MVCIAGLLQSITLECTFAATNDELYPVLQIFCSPMAETYDEVVCAHQTLSTQSTQACGKLHAWQASFNHQAQLQSGAELEYSKASRKRQQQAACAAYVQGGDTSSF